jgi:MFS family permease
MSSPTQQSVSKSTGRVAFRYPNFRLYAMARFVVVIAIEMQAVAVAWQIYGLTHRPLDLGLVGLAQFAPGLFLFLISGHTADHFPRNRVLQCCYGGFALCSISLLALTLHGISTVWPIYCVLLGNGVVRSFNGAASQAFLPLLVDKEHFPNAVAWLTSTNQSAMVLGPSIGGLVYGFTGGPIPVYCCAAVCTLTGLFLMSRTQLPGKAAAGRAPTSGAILEGVRYIWNNKVVLGAASLDLFAVLLGGAVALLPVYAQDILHAGPYGLGILRSAPGLGSILMGVTMAHFPLRHRAGVTMLACVFGFGILTIVFGLSHNILLSMAALVGLGACDMVSVFVRQNLIQLKTPDSMRGRVAAVNMLFIGASNEVGQFESGITAQWFGTVPAVVYGGLGTMAIVLLWSKLFPALRDVDQLQAREDHPEPSRSR